MKRFKGLEFRKISLNTFIQFAVRLVGSFGTLIATLLIAYTLGYESVGSFTKVTAFIGSFYLLVDFGLNSVFLKLYFKNIERQMGNLVLLRLIISSLLIPLALLVSSNLPENQILGTGFSQIEKYAIVVYSLTLVVFSFYNSLQVYLQDKLAYRLTLVPSFCSVAVLIGIIFYAVQNNNFYLLFAAYIFSGTTYGALVFMFIKNKFGLSLSLFKFSFFVRNLLTSAWPLGVVLFFNFMYARTDILILSFYRQNVDVGIYGIAYRFFDVAIAIPTYLANSTYPILLKDMEDRKKYFVSFRKYLFLYGVIALVVMPIAILFSPLIQLFKGEFMSSVVPLQILSLSLPFFFLTSLLQWHFIISGKMKFLVPLYGGALLLNVALNLLFIPKYSYFAAATITGICEAGVFIIMLFYFLKTFHKKGQSSI